MSKYLIILLALSGCATREDDIRDMHSLANDCNGVATISVTRTDSGDRSSYVCTWEQVQL